MVKNNKKSGFVVLLGRSNVGKSTLLNALIGTKAAIVTPKAQTTRHAIQGILHDPRGQVVFVDTPGIFKKSKDLLTQKMTKAAKEALQDIDLVLYVVDPSRSIGTEENMGFDLIKNIKVPKFLVINKIDLKDKTYFNEYFERSKYFDNTFQVSALKHSNLNELVDKIFEVLPEGENFYPDFQLTNLDNKFWFAEFIREKVFIMTSQELPYSINVEVEEITEKPNNVLYIKATIITNKEHHKKMIIGQKAKKIKTIGKAARKELELITNKKVFLDLNVKVDERWVENF